jgi:hypothetical protein
VGKKTISKCLAKLTWQKQSFVDPAFSRARGLVSRDFLRVAVTSSRTRLLVAVLQVLGLA